MTLETLDRLTQALLSLHDHATRDGATARKVQAAMIKEGFTNAEIAEACTKYGTTDFEREYWEYRRTK